MQIFGHAAFIKQKIRWLSATLPLSSKVRWLCHRTFCLIKAAWPKICKKSVFVILLYLLLPYGGTISTIKEKKVIFNLPLLGATTCQYQTNLSLRWDHALKSKFTASPCSTSIWPSASPRHHISRKFEAVKYLIHVHGLAHGGRTIVIYKYASISRINLRMVHLYKMLNYI